MVETRDSTGQPTELVYTLTTVPGVVVADATQVQIIITAALQDSDATVDINAISIQFPLGDGANQLCHDSSYISAPSLTDGYLTTNALTGSEQYVYQPNSPPAQIGSAGLTFDTATMKVASPWVTFSGPSEYGFGAIGGVAVAPDGSRIYVDIWDSGNIWALVPSALVADQGG